MRAAELMAFFGIKRGVNAAVVHPGSALAGEAADLQAPIHIRGVDADADYVARLDAVGTEGFQRFIGDDGVAVLDAGGGGEHVEPAGRDDADTERHITGVDEMDTHGNDLSVPFSNRGEERGDVPRLSRVTLSGHCQNSSARVEGKCTYNACRREPQRREAHA